MNAIDYFGYVGDIAFVIGGIIAARKIGLRFFGQLLSGLSAAFFGGIFIRDLGLLHTFPAIFGNPSEILMTVTAGVLTIAALQHCKNKRRIGKFFNTLLCAADSIGVAGFAVFGYGRGITAGESLWIALACAFVTACGGGIIAAAIRAVIGKNCRHFLRTLAENRHYYIHCAIMSLVCGLWYSPDGYQERTVLALAVTAIISGFMVEHTKSMRK